MRWLEADWNYRSSSPEEHFGERTVTEIIDEANQAVGVGQPHSVPGTWPPMIQLLHREQDFHIVGNRIFKKRDPVADAIDGNCGINVLDADEDVLDELKNQLADDPRAISFLETHPELFVDPKSKEDALYNALNGLNADQLSDFFELLDRESDGDTFAVLGYQQPRDRYEFIIANERHDWANKAERRRVHSGDLRAEVSDIDDEDDLNHFLWRIREDYYNDKELRSQWNEEARQIDRAILLNSLRRQNLDEETIRRRMDFLFDRRRLVQPSLYKVIDGKKFRVTAKERARALYEYRRSDDSIWYKARSRALSELTLTTKQWADIYDIARLRRAEIREHDKERTGQSYQDLRKLTAFINRAKTPKHIEELKVILPEYNYQLTPPHRRSLWESYQVKAVRIARGL